MKEILSMLVCLQLLITAAAQTKENGTGLFQAITVQAGSNLEKEKEAIRKVISNETATYYKQDFEGWKKNFVQEDYFRQHGYWEGYPDKVRYFNGFDTLQQVKELQFKENRTYWKGSYEKRFNENFRIYKDVAWYTFEQDSFEGGTDKFLGRSVELRILEKHQGEWKIAYIGYHYLPVSFTGSVEGK